MNKVMQLGVALGGAAMVVAAGSAYTAQGISGMETQMVSGTASTVVVGAVISNTAYTYTGAVGTDLAIATVTYTTDVDLRLSDVTLTTTGSSNTAACVVNVTTGLSTVCTVTDGWPVASTGPMVLTVTPKA